MSEETSRDPHLPLPSFRDLFAGSPPPWRPINARQSTASVGDWAEFGAELHRRDVDGDRRRPSLFPEGHHERHSVEDAYPQSPPQTVSRSSAPLVHKRLPSGSSSNSTRLRLSTPVLHYRHGHGDIPTSELTMTTLPPLSRRAMASASPLMSHSADPVYPSNSSLREDEGPMFRENTPFRSSLPKPYAMKPLECRQATRDAAAELRCVAGSVRDFQEQYTGKLDNVQALQEKTVEKMQSLEEATRRSIARIEKRTKKKLSRAKEEIKALRMENQALKDNYREWQSRMEEKFELQQQPVIVQGLAQPAKPETPLPLGDACTPVIPRIQEMIEAPDLGQDVEIQQAAAFQDLCDAISSQSSRATSSTSREPAASTTKDTFSVAESNSDRPSSQTERQQSFQPPAAPRTPQNYPARSTGKRAPRPQRPPEGRSRAPAQGKDRLRPSRTAPYPSSQLSSPQPARQQSSPQSTRQHSSPQPARQQPSYTALTAPASTPSSVSTPASSPAVLPVPTTSTAPNGPGQDIEPPSTVRCSPLKVTRPDGTTVSMFVFNKHFDTLEDQWAEYQHGILGQRPVRYMDETYTTKWRQDSYARTWYSRRKRLWDIINRSMAQGLSEADALAKVKDMMGDMTVRGFIEHLALSGRKNSNNRQKTKDKNASKSNVGGKKRARGDEAGENANSGDEEDEDEIVVGGRGSNGSSRKRKRARQPFSETEDEEEEEAEREGSSQMGEDDAEGRPSKRRTPPVLRARTGPVIKTEDTSDSEDSDKEDGNLMQTDETGRYRSRYWS